MKISTSIAIAAAVLAIGIAPAGAAKKGDAAYAQREASCKAQAAKKFSAIRFLARKDFVDKCMGTKAAKATTTKKKMTTAKKQKMEPSTTGQTVR
jgi:hypothetical protein